MKKPKKKRMKDKEKLRIEKIVEIYKQLEEYTSIDRDETCARICKIVDNGRKLLLEGKARGLIIATDEVSGFTMASGNFGTPEQLAETIASFISATKFNMGIDSLEFMELITKNFIKFDDRTENTDIKRLDGWT